MTSDYASSDTECLTGDVPVNCSCIDADPERNGPGFGSENLFKNNDLGEDFLLKWPSVA